MNIDIKDTLERIATRLNSYKENADMVKYTDLAVKGLLEAFDENEGLLEWYLFNEIKSTVMDVAQHEKRAEMLNDDSEENDKERALAMMFASEEDVKLMKLTGKDLLVQSWQEDLKEDEEKTTEAPAEVA